MQNHILQAAGGFESLEVGRIEPHPANEAESGFRLGAANPARTGRPQNSTHPVDLDQFGGVSSAVLISPPDDREGVFRAGAC